MECLLAFLILMVMFAVVTGTVARAQTRRAKRRRTYRHVAKRFAGQYLPGGIFGRPGIRFRYGTTRALYREARAIPPLSGRCAEMRLDWPNAKMQVELYRDPDRIHPAGMRTNRVGISEREFETDYVINGRDDGETANLLSEGVRWQLHRLRLTAADDNLYVKIHHGRLTVQKPSSLTRQDELAEFVQLVLELYDQAMLTQVVGIDFLNSDVAQPLDDVICKVCGDAIEFDMVCCHRCKTPHHHDCWTYNGACSVYGCQETRYVAPRSAQPTSPTETPDASDNPFGPK
jgi:hypothetical protein